MCFWVLGVFNQIIEIKAKTDCKEMPFKSKVIEQTRYAAELHGRLPLMGSQRRGLVAKRGRPGSFLF